MSFASKFGTVIALGNNRRQPAQRSPGVGSSAAENSGAASSAPSPAPPAAPGNVQVDLGDGNMQIDQTGTPGNIQNELP